MLKNISYLLILITSPFLLIAQEICDNGIDDNGNGLIDLNDPDCDCGQEIESLIPNPSFEERSCCPTSLSHLYCADTWIQATEPTTDYFNCDYSLPAADNAGITPPDGTGYVGAFYAAGWMEYVGACILQPMIAGETYVLTFDIASFPMSGSGGSCNLTYGDVDVTIYGSTNCLALPVNTTGCPSGVSAQWDVISTENYSPSSNWGTITFEITPTQNINAIMIGPPCTLPSDYPPLSSGNCSPYFVFDNIVLASADLFSPITLNELGSSCANNLTLNATSDIAGGNWQWYFEGEAIIGETSGTLDVSGLNLGFGEYNVVFSTGADCFIQNYMVEPSQTPLPVAGFEFTNICLGSQINFVDTSWIDTTGGFSIDNWSWSFDDGNTSSNQNPSHTYLNAGNYNVTLVVESNNGCTDSISHSVDVFPIPNASFTANPTIGNVPLDVDFLDNSTNGVDYSWNFGNGDTSSLINPSTTYSQSGTYQVVLYISNEMCSDEAVITIVVEKPLIYIIPNIITPNGDGSNDVLDMNISNAESVEIEIFNRWGNLVGTVNSLDPKEGWDGKHKNSGKPVSDGVYFYTYKITSIYGEVVEGHQYLHVSKER